jgi:hypothetical protein
MKKTHEFQIADKTMRKAHPNRFALLDRFRRRKAFLGQSKVTQLNQTSTNFSDYRQNCRSYCLPIISDPDIIPIC